MNKALLALLTILIILVAGWLTLKQMQTTQEDICQSREVCQVNLTSKYQGPVRPTDDEAYFRKTGITIKK